MSRWGTLAVGWTLALLAIALFASLGRWQLGRMHEKQAMLDAVEATVSERRPLALSAAADATRATGYDWAAGEGAFPPVPAVLLDNQQREGRVGVRVYRLFRPDHGGPLLVELGWLRVPGDRRMPAIDLPQGRQRVQGLLAPPPSPGIVAVDVAKTDHGDLLVTGLRASTLPTALQLDMLPPRVLRLDPASPLGYARDLDALPNTLPPGKHLGYAMQWFGLALAVFATALVLTLRRLRR